MPPKETSPNNAPPDQPALHPFGQQLLRHLSMAGPSVSDGQIFKEALTSLTPDQLKSVAKDVVASASPEQRQLLLHAIPADQIKPLLASIPDRVLAPAVAPQVPPSPPTVAPAEILQTTYTNMTFDTSSPDWAKNVCGGSKLGLTSPPKWEWMPVFANAQFEREGSLENPVVGLTGWVSLDGKLSGGDVPFTHPFGFDWEFFVVPDPQYESLLAPSNTGKSSNGVVTDAEYSDATTHAQDTLRLQAPKGVLGVETDQGLVPEPFRLAVTDSARIAVFGRWIIDGGHEDFHSEIHPPLLMAVAKPTPAVPPLRSAGTAVQIMSRPYLVSQQFPDGNFVTQLIAEVLKAEVNIFGIPLSLRVEAHPTVLTPPYDKRTLIKLLVKPPVPKRGPFDRLAVSFHFTHRKGVAVQLFQAAEDTVGVLILLGDLNPAQLPAKHDHSVSVGDLHKIDPGDADIYATVIGADVLLNPQAALVLARGILTDLYDAPSASSPLDNQNVASSVFVDKLNPAIGLSEDDTQPFPIYGWLNVGWLDDPIIKNF